MGPGLPAPLSSEGHTELWPTGTCTLVPYSPRRLGPQGNLAAFPVLLQDDRVHKEAPSAAREPQGSPGRGASAVSVCTGAAASKRRRTSRENGRCSVGLDPAWARCPGSLLPPPPPNPAAACAASPASRSPWQPPRAELSPGVIRPGTVWNPQCCT
ncbi:immediate early response gene 5-like protein isoform X1 [Heterocephalus glaber]|uniref:Immediate early response gene 5-like protein isoform X1 n=1 Tax=Heterocephalus glaber TaxID=10181 RepID=A0AAX6RFL1_HETGA|nr:immediate early response gene 5-like protein isoform X1 [Heterocephalus glaber]